jgi:DNA-binding response OmpR family regulator
MDNLIYLASSDLAAHQISQAYLEKEGFRVVHFESGSSLYDTFLQQPCTLAIIDTVMKEGSGFVAGAKLRQHSGVPIIMLAAEDCDEDYIFSLSLGLDAYLSKPFCPTRLVAYARAFMIKNGAWQSTEPAPKLETQTQLAYGDLTICLNRIMTYCNNMEVRLTNTEFKVLSMMLENKDRAIARDEFLSKVWGNRGSIGGRAVDDVIKRLRKKLNERASRVNIDTVWGMGFRLGEKAAE